MTLQQRLFACQRFIVCVWIVFLAACFNANFIAAQTKPNVIVIISDDAGYADFGFGRNALNPGGSTNFRDPESGLTIASLTPNLDALAQRGVTFSRGYVAANCQPTRAAIVTGGYQQRIGNENVGNNNYLASETCEGVPDTTKTIWDRMKTQGYTTGAIGKWHLGQIADQTDAQGNVTVRGNRPQNQGIDEFRGIWHGSRSYQVGSVANTASKRNQTQILREAVVKADGTVEERILEQDYAGDYITDTFGELATDFISDHANQSQPFFLYQSFTAPHKPWTNESPYHNDPRISGLRDGSYRRQVAGLQLAMDAQIGKMLERLEDPNGDGDTSDSIADDTTIIFVNDNGGVAGVDPSSGLQGIDNGPLAGFKGSPRDGGIRVPFLIAGAGVSQSAQGTIYDKPVHGIDILPTAVGLGGGTLGPEETKIDGVDLLPFANGEDAGDPHDVLVHRWRGTFAVIDGEYKLINTANLTASNQNPEFQYRLYNTASDVDENDNLINDTDQAARVARLKRELTRHEAFFDKGRYAILNRSIDDDASSTAANESRNIFDHFVANPNGRTSFNWGDTDLWLAGPGGDNLQNSDASSPGKTMYTSDSFAGAIVEFGTTDNQSYTANNNLFRQTGGTFMLNKMMLSGNFDGSQNRSATIQGRDLLFTNDLDGNAPEIAIDAMNVGGSEFSFTINNDMEMFDNLTISGDGNVAVTVNGQIRDFFEARNLTKTGTSRVVLAGQNTYKGNTIVMGGTLALAGSGSIDESAIIDVQSGAVLDVAATDDGTLDLVSGQTLQGDGQVVGNVIAKAGSAIEPGAEFGELSVSGDLSLEVGALLAIELRSLSEFDKLNVDGNLNLEGDLAIFLAADFSANAGDSFDILDFGNLAGDFETVFLPTFSNGLEWDSSDLLTLGELHVVSAVPEPSSAFALGLFAIVGIAQRRRR
jgi:autotransporter-associated beta strand protein